MQLQHALLEVGVGVGQIGARLAQALAGARQPCGGRPYFGLQRVEARCHLADFVARDDAHRRDVDAGVGGIEIPARERVHGPRKLRQSACGETFGRAGDLHGRVRDHSRQNESHRDRKHGDGDEDVGQSRHQNAMLLWQIVDGQQVARSIQQQHEQHGTGQLDLQGASHSGQTGTAPIIVPAPSVQH